MEPINFKEANKMLKAPNNVAKNLIRNLHVFTDKNQCISCWKLSFLGLIKVILTRKIWVSVLFGETQPPINVDTDYPFKKEKK